MVCVVIFSASHREPHCRLAWTCSLDGWVLLDYAYTDTQKHFEFLKQSGSNASTDVFEQHRRNVHFALHYVVDGRIVYRVVQVICADGLADIGFYREVHDKVVSPLSLLGKHTMVGIEG